MGEMDMGDQTGVPLESDTATATGEPPTPTDRAEQLRAEARAPLAPPSHFDTPSWLGPSTRDFTPPPQQVPAQTEPLHDQLHPYARPAAEDSVPDTAHWVEHRSPRVFVGVLLTLALLGAAAALVVTIINQSVIAMGAFVVCALVAVIFRGALMSSGLTTVDLQNATLRVRLEGELSVFNLADPTERVEITGTPGSPDWKVVLESIHHREVTLTAAHVNAQDFHQIVTHYRALADQERRDREARFNR